MPEDKPLTTDERLRSFLDALDDADFEVSNYAASWLNKLQDKYTFTNHERMVIRRLQSWYGERLVW